MAMTLISEQVLGSSAASVTFSSIPSTFKDLVLEFTGTNSLGSGNIDAYMLFNSDSATNYSYTYVRGNGSVAASPRASNTSSPLIGWSGQTGSPSAVTANIMSYANSSTYKAYLSRSSEASNMVAAFVGTWRSTAPITSVQIAAQSSYSYAAGSTFRLWGVS